MKQQSKGGNKKKLFLDDPTSFSYISRSQTSLFGFNCGGNNSIVWRSWWITGGETNCAQIGRKISLLTLWQSCRKYLESGATLAAGAIGSIAFKEAWFYLSFCFSLASAYFIEHKAGEIHDLLWNTSGSINFYVDFSPWWAHGRMLTQQLVDAIRPGHLNWALMDLGATVCTWTSPSCASCRIACHCKALELVRQLENKISSVTILHKLWRQLSNSWFV